MKNKSMTNIVWLAVMSLVGIPEREECSNESSTAGTVANGIKPYTAEAAITTRYLLVQKGAADNGVIINSATARPLGVCLDEPLSGNKTAVALLGSSPGTLKVRANGAIAAGAMVFTTAGGKVGAWSAGSYLVGRALTAAAADGDLVEADHLLPLLAPTATTF